MGKSHPDLTPKAQTCERNLPGTIVGCAWGVKSSPDYLNDNCPILIETFVTSYHKFHMQIQLGRWPANNMKKLRRTFANCQG